MDVVRQVVSLALLAVGMVGIAVGFWRQLRAAESDPNPPVRPYTFGERREHLRKVRANDARRDDDLEWMRYLAMTLAHGRRQFFGMAASVPFWLGAAVRHPGGAWLWIAVAGLALSLTSFVVVRRNAEAGEAFLQRHPDPRGRTERA